MQATQTSGRGYPYTLLRRRVAGDGPQGHVWVVKSGYHTPPPQGDPPLPSPSEFEALDAAGLREWVSGLPPRCVITFTHNRGGARLPSGELPKEAVLMLEDFRQFCQSQGVVLVVMNIAI